jgi:hypothetical protein
MKRFAFIENNEVKQIGGLPTNWGNISNFYLLNFEDQAEMSIINQNGWLPVETISENKEIQENVEYVIEENVVKEIITTRDKTQEEIENENQSQIEAKWYSARFKRNNLLKESDIEILSDKWEVMDVATKSLWSNYRKQLRDIPQIFSNSDDIIWPIKP